MTTCPFCPAPNTEHTCTTSRTVSADDYRADPGKYAAAARFSGPITVLNRNGEPAMVVSVPGPSPVPCGCCEEEFGAVLDALEDRERFYRCADGRDTVSSTQSGGMRALRILAKHDRFTITDDDGKRVVGRWRDG